MHIGDLETDGLPFQCTKVWLNITYCPEENQYYFSFNGEALKEFGIVPITDYIRKNLCENFYVVGTLEKHFNLLSKERTCYHNFGQFDRIVIRKLIDSEWEPGEFEDTYILSQVLNPDRGKHGIEAWGERFGIPKPKHEEWDKFSLDMINRCFQDVRIGVKTWFALQEEMKDWDWSEAIRIEYGIAKLQGEQEYHGVLLDIDKAYALADEIYTEIQKIDETLLEQMPLRVIQGSEVSKPFRKDGQLTKVTKRWFE